MSLIDRDRAVVWHPYTQMLLSAVPDIEGAQKSVSAIYADATPSGAGQATACPFADRCPWKLGPVCDNVPPPWRAASETHGIRCHIPLQELGRPEPSPQQTGAARSSPSPLVRGRSV